MSRWGLIDLTPLRASPPFRRLWVSGLLTGFTQQAVVVAVLYQVWNLTQSPLWTGAIGAVSAVATITASLIGGALADTYDRRSIIRWSTVGQFLAAGGLVAQAAAQLDHVWVVLALVALSAGASGIGTPARQSLTTRMLTRDLVASGLALQQLSFQAAMIIGPAISGFVIGWLGEVGAYAIRLAAMPMVLYAVIRLPRIPHVRTPDRMTMRTIVDGLRYIRHHRMVRGSLGVDLLSTLLVMPIALFPMINQERFGGSAETLGLFLSAIAVGGITVGVVFSGRVTNAQRTGAVQLWAASAWCLSLALFGVSGELWLTLLMLAVAGAADSVAVISRGALVQLATADSHLGRVSAVNQAIGVGGPDLGNARAGLVAGLTSAPFALVSGAFLALLGIGWIAVRNTELRQARKGDLE